MSNAEGWTQENITFWCFASRSICVVSGLFEGDETLQVLLGLTRCPLGGIVRHTMRVLHNLLHNFDLFTKLCSWNYLTVLVGMSRSYFPPFLPPLIQVLHCPSCCHQASTKGAIHNISSRKFQIHLLRKGCREMDQYFSFRC